jgi:TIR domain
MNDEGSPRITVFLSYAHEDDRFRSLLLKALAPLKREDSMTVWHDREIVPGQDWARQIDQHLAAADVIVLSHAPQRPAPDLGARPDRRRRRAHRTEAAEALGKLGVGARGQRGATRA